MSEGAGAPCAGCGTYRPGVCVCKYADAVEKVLATKGVHPRMAVDILTGLAPVAAVRLLTVLQYRAHDRGYQMGLKEGGPRGGNG